MIIMLNGKLVSDDLLDRERHEYRGIWRPPFPDITTGCYAVYCPQEHMTKSREELRRHWTGGCFDVPEYVNRQPSRPNTEGSTTCVVRWMEDTSGGWVGAYDKEALDAFKNGERNRTIRDVVAKLREYGEQAEWMVVIVEKMVAP